MKPVSHVLIAILLWIGSWLLYYPSLDLDFSGFDDTKVLLGHPNLYNEHSFSSSLKEILLNYFPREEPLILRDMTWALDSRLFGFQNPFGYHFGNVVLNSCNVVLLFIWLTMMRRKSDSSECRERPFDTQNTLITAVYAVLPVHVEAVSWIMGRKDMLVTFLMLLTLIAQTAYLEIETKEDKEVKPLRRFFWLITVLTTTAALLSKISAISFAAVLAAHQMFYPYLKGYREQLSEAPSPLSLERLKTVLLRLTPHFLITAVVFMWYKRMITTWGVLDRGVDSLSWQHLSNLIAFTPVVIGMYIKFILIPFEYSSAYSWPSVNEPFTVWDSMLSACCAGLIGIISVVLYHRRKDLFFYWLSFFLLMIPYLNLIYSGIWIANRYIYFSSVCILVIIFYSLFSVCRVRSVFYTLLTAWMIVNIVQTYRYQQVWRNDLTLAQHETRLKNPSIFAYASLINSYLIRAETETNPESKADMIRQAERALNEGRQRFETAKTHPDMFRFYYLQANLAELKGESLQTQLDYLLKAYEIMPMMPHIPKKISVIYYRLAMQSQVPEDRIRWAQDSLNFFKGFLELVRDPIANQTSLKILDNQYAKDFPFLSEQISQIKSNIIRLEFR